MNRLDFIEELKTYRTSYSEEEIMLIRMISFVEKHENCFERSLEIGHMTASCWVLNVQTSQVLLLFHKKLQKWLQPGGHCDGNQNIREVAEKELEEETGLRISSDDLAIFDVDIHTIPQKGEIAEHEHFDVRFLFKFDGSQTAQVNHESEGLQWVSISDLVGDETENSIKRMAQKSLSLFNYNTI